MDQGYVTQFLASMPQLEYLWFEPHGMATVGALPQDMIYPQLGILSFSCGEVGPEKPVSFVRRHGSTLKKLWINYCNIPPHFKQGWQDVADQLNDLRREGALPKLVNLSFHEVYIGETVVACGETDKYPKEHFDKDEVDYKQVHSWGMKKGTFRREFKY
jgi:hypothetical protein